MFTKALLSGVIDFRIYEPRPNPAAADVTFLFDLPRPLDARVMLYDVSGRVVRELGPFAFPTGALRSITWDGRDADGEEAAAGVYFYRVLAGGQEASGRLIRVR